jgi:hypothetical protein
MRTPMALPRGAVDEIAEQITEEKGSSLARTGEKLEAALAALAAADVALAACPGDEALVAGRESAVREAARWAYYLLVQRDAIGPSSHDEVFRIYGVPGDVRRLVGTRRAS